ncbi:MAG: VOC family protein [Pseudomonadota bacterium]|nr:VOC family protein [Pseudomonadota bacterium]
MNESSTIPVCRLDHISIAVPNLDLASKFYMETFDCDISKPIELPDQNMRIAYVKFSNIRIELMEATGENSAVTKFLKRYPTGGLHHFCFSTPDATSAAKIARSKNIRVIGKGLSHDDKDLFFLHPKDTLGTLIEIEEN